MERANADFLLLVFLEISLPKIQPYMVILVSPVQGSIPISSQQNNKMASCIHVVLFIRFGEMMRCGQLYGVLLQDAAQLGFTFTLLN